jgi:anti-sigma factor RsiW
VRCEQLTDLLAATGGDTTMLDLRARTHLEGCLRCQAELAQYRKLLKALRTLRTEVLTPAPGLVSDIFAHLEAAGERQAMRSVIRGRKAAYVGGIAVASVAAAGGAAIVLASRSRRTRLSA